MRALRPEVLLPVVSLVARAYFGLHVEGVHHIPLEGPLVIVPNHVTYADPPLVAVGVRRPVFFMAWNRLFRIPLFGRFIRFLRAFPVETESADPSATREAVRVLKAGHALMIFPEGSRTLDGCLERFKPGAFRLACAHQAPVLPVTIIGGHELWPPGRLFPRPGRITIVYHSPVTPPPAGDRHAAARELSRQVRAAIASRLPSHQQALDSD